MMKERANYEDAFKLEVARMVVDQGLGTEAAKPKSKPSKVFGTVQKRLVLGTTWRADSHRKPAFVRR